MPRTGDVPARLIGYFFGVCLCLAIGLGRGSGRMLRLGGKRRGLRLRHLLSSETV